jgi:hypothetical protein
VAQASIRVPIVKTRNPTVQARSPRGEARRHIRWPPRRTGPAAPWTWRLLSSFAPPAFGSSPPGAGTRVAAIIRGLTLRTSLAVSTLPLRVRFSLVVAAIVALVIDYISKPFDIEEVKKTVGERSIRPSNWTTIRTSELTQSVRPSACVWQGATRCGAAAATCPATRARNRGGTGGPEAPGGSAAWQ